MSLTKIFRKSSVGLAKEFWVLLKECSSVPLLAVRIDSDQALNFITEEKESQIEGGNYYRTTSQSPQNTLTSIPYVILFSFLFFYSLSISYMSIRNCIHFHAQLIFCSLPSCYLWIPSSQVCVQLFFFFSLCVNQHVWLRLHALARVQSFYWAMNYSSMTIPLNSLATNINSLWGWVGVSLIISCTMLKYWSAQSWVALVQGKHKCSEFINVIPFKDMKISFCGMSPYLLTLPLFLPLPPWLLWKGLYRKPTYTNGSTVVGSLFPTFFFF